MVRHVRCDPEAEEGCVSVWAPDLLQALALTCHRALRALPSAAPNLLATVNALATVSPTAVQVRHGSCLPHTISYLLAELHPGSGLPTPLLSLWLKQGLPASNQVFYESLMQGYDMLQTEMLFGLWTTALAQGTASKSAAFHAALQLISMPQPSQSTLASEHSCSAPMLQ